MTLPICLSRLERFFLWNEVTIWWDPSNVSQYVRRLYGMDEPIRNVCIYYLEGSFLRILLILTIRKNYKETIWYARETIWYGWFMWIYYLEVSFFKDPSYMLCHVVCIDQSECCICFFMPIYGMKGP